LDGGRGKRPRAGGRPCRPFNPIFVTRNPLTYAEGPGHDEVIDGRRMGPGEDRADSGDSGVDGPESREGGLERD
jgi:hypothetical protein